MGDPIKDLRDMTAPTPAPPLRPFPGQNDSYVPPNVYAGRVHNDPYGDLANLRGQVEMSRLPLYRLQSGLDAAHARAQAAYGRLRENLPGGEPSGPNPLAQAFAQAREMLIQRQIARMQARDIPPGNYTPEEWAYLSSRRERMR